MHLPGPQRGLLASVPPPMPPRAASDSPLSTLDRKIRRGELEIRREGRRVYVRLEGPEYVSDEELLRSSTHGTMSTRIALICSMSECSMVSVRSKCPTPTCQIPGRK